LSSARMAGVPQVVQSPQPDPVIDVTHDCLSGDRVLMLRIASLEQRSSRGVSMPTLSPASIPTDEQVFVDKLIGQSPWSTRSVTPSTQCGRRDGQARPRCWLALPYALEPVVPVMQPRSTMRSHMRSRAAVTTWSSHGRLLWSLLSGITGECPVARQSSRHAVEGAGERRGSIAPRHCCLPALCR